MVARCALLAVRHLQRRHEFQLRLSHLICFQLSLYPEHHLKSYNMKRTNDVVIFETLLNLYHRRGGGKIRTNWTASELTPYYAESKVLPSHGRFQLVSYDLIHKAPPDTYQVRLPLNVLAPQVSLSMLQDLCKKHSLSVIKRNIAKTVYIEILTDHTCQSCPDYVCYFKWSVSASTERSRSRRTTVHRESESKTTSQSRLKRWRRNNRFPPPPPSPTLIQDIISDFVQNSTVDQLREEGCAVCGCLTSTANLLPLADLKPYLGLLCVPEVTRRERFSLTEDIRSLHGPVLAEDCDKVCSICTSSLQNKRVPHLALANGLWLGKVPPVLADLSWMEQRLISRIAFNYCVVRVHASGLYKMRANAVSHAIPMTKVYNILPPKREDLDDVLAFIYIGPTAPTPKEYKRTPFLVRRNKVAAALEWLKLNHSDYSDLTISYDNLKDYPENVPPVLVDYHPTTGQDDEKDPEATAVNDADADVSTSHGEVPFVVHGLTGKELTDMWKDNPQRIRMRAMKHFATGGKALAIGHAEHPESLYDNSSLYPSMFPWLFPYGHGGLGNDRMRVSVSDSVRKRNMLMYHDKRFQLDQYFSLIAFNHQQMKSSTTGGYLLAEKRNFTEVANRLSRITSSTLDNLIERLKDGPVTPVTDEERECFRLIGDLDFVGAHVDGSVTNRKRMRNEIWSMTSYLGAPTWFITFAPADVNHPICLYYAGTDQTHFPIIRDKNERLRLIARNPVAGARFFDFMVRMFIEHVLKFQTNKPGLYGKTSGYYGTVEQQGRLTLHMHMLVWIKHSLTPQEVRDNILDSSRPFQTKIVEYLESLHKGEFIDRTMSSVQAEIEESEKQDPTRIPPTESLPEPPVYSCEEECFCCKQCEKSQSWWNVFKSTVNEIVYRSNIHQCHIGCTTKSHPTCKSRFPRDVYKETTVDPETGALNLKKGEAWMNTYTPVLTYLMRCNTDVTSLLSGTAIKSVIAYVTDYITKSPLKTHTIFEAVKSVFSKLNTVITKESERLQRARQVITKTVNALTSQSEIGSPMAAMYLLKNPDHYKSHELQRFYWRRYVTEVKQAWDNKDQEDEFDKMDIDEVDKSEPEPVVVLSRNHKGIVGVSPVLDYMYRPNKYENVSLYDWIRLSRKIKARQKSVKDENGQYVVDAIVGHCWQGGQVRFRLLFETGETRWQSHASCSRLTALDDYLELQNVTVWQELSKTIVLDVRHDVVLLNNTAPDDHHDDISDSTDDDELEDNDSSLSSIDDDMDDNSSEAKDIEMNGLEVNYHRWATFQPAHPQSDTHKVQMLTENSAVVPDFVGGPLPRRDKGNREDYCMTMLTLFKPWRTGLELKTLHEPWDSAFTSYEWPERFSRLMHFFHLRYECNDARDDFSAQRKSQAKNTVPHGIDDYMIGLLNDEHNEQEYIEHNGLCDREGEIEVESYSAQTLRRIKQMQEAERIMQTSGLMDPMLHHSKDNIGENPVFLERDGTAHHWQSVLDEKKKKILEERQRLASARIEKKLGEYTNKTANEVKVINQSYLQHNYIPRDPNDRQLITDTIKLFTLNKEQARAFAIVANHATAENPDQLKMYLGGMAGTGKSQVIKALMHFFTQRNESYRFMCMAPTGAAASLIGGSTYHSVLGINNYQEDHSNPITMAETRATLRCVDYIFMDEISMIDCGALYNICKRMCKIFDNETEAFGGMNMIFAGDFAQLPPPAGYGALYAHTVQSVVHTTLSYKQQEASIGKAVWHQFTTAVILRQNMRQRSQTSNDAKFRTVLENLRYKACTEDDIRLLRSCIARRDDPERSLANPNFRNVSIITSWNTYRDKLNEMGCERFADETGQALTHFYSVDRFKSEKGDSAKRRRSYKIKIDPKRQSNRIGPRLQHILWTLSPGCSNHHPGKLSLCVGMPVMIKKNKATECSVTNGAEGVVVGWKTRPIDEDHVALDVLFVRLTSPPQPIQLEDLPENVVPVAHEQINIACTLPDGKVVNISRGQVPIVLNFGMTDFGSQGRTRKYNVCDLQNCRNHQSVYTCLSRGSTYAGTLIVQGFDSSKLTGGLSGYLRQEFRELELLDEITELRFNNQLSKNVVGLTRSQLISSYRNHKGEDYIPHAMPGPLKWSAVDPFKIEDPIDEADWEILNHKKAPKETKNQGDQNDIVITNVGTSSQATRFVPAKGTIQLPQISTSQGVRLNKKRKRNSQTTNDDDDDDDDVTVVGSPPLKKQMQTQSESIDEPIGFIWDADQYSCAYDSLFSILLGTMKSMPDSWAQVTELDNRYLTEFDQLFADIEQDLTEMECSRDMIRKMLFAADANAFPQDQRGTDVRELCYYMLTSESESVYRVLYCKHCRSELQSEETQNLDIWHCSSQTWQRKVARLGGINDQPTSQWLKAIINSKSTRLCPTCHKSAQKLYRFNTLPLFIPLAVENNITVILEHTATFYDGQYKLVGIIYHGGFHFTCRIIDSEGQIWYNDGVRTGRKSEYEGNMKDFNPRLLLQAREGRKCTVAVYMLITDV